MPKRSRLSRGSGNKKQKRLSIVLIQQEGVLADTIDVKMNGKRESLSNVPATWEWLKMNLEAGVDVTVERHMWDGRIQRFDWKGSPSYNYRFG